MFYPKKSTCCIVGTPEVLGPRGYWGIKLITFTDHALNPCPISKRNHVEVVELIFVGILFWVWATISHETTCWFLERKSKWETKPLWSIELKQWNLGVCKDFEENITLETKSFHLSKSFCNIPLVYVCPSMGMCTMQEVFPFLFGDTIPFTKSSCLAWHCSWQGLYINLFALFIYWRKMCNILPMMWFMIHLNLNNFAYSLNP